MATSTSTWISSGLPLLPRCPRWPGQSAQPCTNCRHRERTADGDQQPGPGRARLRAAAAGLEPFADRAMTAVAPAGRDWLELLEARDNTRHGSAKKLSKTDPALLLRVLTEERRVFQDALSRSESSFASVLRDSRNGWAHNEAFTGEDASLALELMDRLLTAAGATEQAEEVRRLRLDHQRALYEADTRKAVKAAATVS